MSEYPEGQNLDNLDVATPHDGASAYELALAIRQIKSVLKAVVLNAHQPNGMLKGGSVTEVAAGAVGETQLADGSVISAKLATGAVVNGKIGALAVTADKIATAAITETKYAAASIPTSAFKPNSIPLSAFSETFSSAYLADNAIVSRHIASSSITDAKVADVAVGKLTGGSNGQFLFNVSGVWTPVSAGGALVYSSETGTFSFTSGLAAAYFADVKTSGNDGGAGTSGTWVQRSIAEMANMDQADITTFNSNCVIFDIGTYFIHARCPAYGVGMHKARLMKRKVADDSDPTVVCMGSNAVAPAGVQTDSIIECYVVVADSLWKYYIEHYVDTAVGATDFGLATDATSIDEVYTQGYAVKVA